MRTLMSGVTALLLTLSSALAADKVITVGTNGVPDSIPVGNESFFRQEGVKLVRRLQISGYGNTRPDAQPSETYPYPEGYGWQVIFSWGYYPPAGKAYTTEAELLQFAKESLADYASTFDNPNALYYVRVEWIGGTDTIGFTVFRDVANFRLERDSTGTLRPPVKATENLRMKIGDTVFMRVTGVRDARLRWWDGTEFQDSNRYRGNVGLTSTKKFVQTPLNVAVDIESGIISLPTKPILERNLGVLTFKRADETIVRYSTGTGVKLPGKQEAREPLLLAIGRETYSDGTWILNLFPSGDYVNPGGGYISNVILFERSKDLLIWQEIVQGTDGWADATSMGVLPSAIGRDFFRARYR